MLSFFIFNFVETDHNNSTPSLNELTLSVNTTSAPTLERDSFGVHTLKSAIFDVTYHSIHGVFQEAQHVYLQMGMYKALEQQKTINILEIGFGSGLNALLTALEIENMSDAKINYTATEAFPISPQTAASLNYPELLATQYNTTQKHISELLLKLHQTNDQESIVINNHFEFKKQIIRFQEIADKNAYDVTYFDAFAPTAQPELWTIEIFERMFTCLKPSGLLTTYCAKGQVRRNMQAVGFVVERLPGPLRKREMLRATKPASALNP